VGQIVYRACLIIFWITLNCCTMPFGVWVEPLWREQSKFRFLQFPGNIPVIAVALPILLAYAAYRTFLVFGIWHVILPFAAIGATAAIFLGSFIGLNVFRERGARGARDKGLPTHCKPPRVPRCSNQMVNPDRDLGSPSSEP
jgi:hypothetical protein